MRASLRSRWLSLAAAALLALAGAGCQNDTADAPAPAAQGGNGADRAFVAEMVPHHRSAVEMAEIAAEEGQSRFVRELAGDISHTQEEEIVAMEARDRALADQGIERGDLGVPAHAMGMDDDPGALRGAQPFDREFVDMMIPHHQGAIVMARAELARGRDRELARVAQNVIAAQAREIKAMNEFRRREFGSPSPAGGVPPVADEQGRGDHPG